MKIILKTTRVLICLMLCAVTVCLMAAPASAALKDPYTPVPTAAVRSKPSEHSSRIGFMTQGTMLSVLEETGDFYLIDCWDMEGYIHKSNVEQLDGEYYVNCSGSTDGQLFYARPAEEIMAMRGDLYERALSVQGVPYVSAGSSPRGFDCSGFTSWIYREYRVDIGSYCDLQLSRGIIIPKENLQCGDLVFFQNTAPGSGISSHVGLYLGDGKLIHAGSRGITVVELESRYFVEHYLCSRRMVLTDTERADLQSLLTTVLREEAAATQTSRIRSAATE